MNLDLKEEKKERKYHRYHIETKNVMDIVSIPSRFYVKVKKHLLFSIFV